MPCGGRRQRQHEAPSDDWQQLHFVQQLALVQWKVESLLQDYDDKQPGTNVKAVSYTVGGQIMNIHYLQAKGEAGTDTDIYKYLQEPDHEWAWMVLQEQSQYGGLLNKYANYDYSRDAIVELDKLLQESSPRAATVLYNTWGR